MKKRTRKHSALLLLMAPIIALGSSALVAGTAASAGATAKKLAAPTITIREVAPGAFRFTLNGSVVSLKGSSGVFKARIGINTVSEFYAPALYRAVSKISVVPPAARLGASLRTASATLKLGAGKSATVTFTNTEVAVTEPVTAPSNPEPATPPPVTPAAGGSAPVTPAPVTPTAGGSDPTGTTTGLIEICKSAADPWVEGTFNFTVNGGTTVYPLTLTPPALWSITDLSFGIGNIAPTVCTGGISVPAGTVTVVEGSGSEPGYGLADVYSAPGIGPDNNEPASVDLATQTATFTVTAGLETTADFVDATQFNFIKVCKVLANNFGTANDTVSADLAGTTIDYDVSWTWAPSTLNLTTASYAGSEPASVVAVPAPGVACSLVPWAIPAGSAVTITEPQSVAIGAVPNSAPPYISVSNVSIVPDTFNNGTTATSTEALLTVPPVSDGYADAVFTNIPLGAIEVCKYFDPATYNNGKYSATFTVAEGSFTPPPFTLTPGLNGCTPEMAVPVGTAAVDETTANTGNFLLESVLAYGPEGAVASNRLATPVVPGSGMASVLVPYGGEGNISEVAYTNEVDPTQFKICKQTTDSSLAGDTFTFTWSYPETTWLAAASGTVTLTLPKAVAGVSYSALVCSDLTYGLFDGPPAVNPDGSVTPITVVEAATPNVEATAGTWSGTTGFGGGLLWAGTSRFPTGPDSSATVKFDPGAGTNAVTFTNQSECDCLG
ncbi:MAG: hypothetical protein ABR972_04050 [Acidimicrobiales bacterium]